jgi:hypothetical protein
MESDGIDIRDFYFYPALMDAFDGRFQGQSGQPTHTQVKKKRKQNKTKNASLFRISHICPAACAI